MERTDLARINGAPYDGYLIPGTYASIERTWNEGDRIELDLDMRARVVDAPSGSGDGRSSADRSCWRSTRA